MAFLQTARDHALKTALDALFPPRCASCQMWCQGRAWRRDPFCAACLARIIAPTLGCARCGSPREVALDGRCSDCDAVRWPPALRLMRACDRYQGPVRDAVHRFKYEGKTALAAGLGARLHRWCEAQPGSVPRLPIERVALVVPVPMHSWRWWRRGFNQSELLARELARHCGVACDLTLRRTRYTPPQVSLDAPQRAGNVRGAFALDARRAAPPEGAVLLLDDVTTTGATLVECAWALQDAGAREIYALSLARA